MKQGTILKAKCSFTFRAYKKGKAVTVTEGQEFWVTTTECFLKDHGCVRIQRKGKGHISTGWLFTLETINSYFEVVI